MAQNLLEAWRQDNSPSTPTKKSFSKKVKNEEKDRRSRLKESQKQVILSLLSSEEPKSMNEFYEEYSNQVIRPMERRTIRNYLTELRNEEKVRKLGKGPGARYQKSTKGSKSRASILIEDELMEDLEEVDQDLEKAFNAVLRKGLEKISENSCTPGEE